MLTLILSLSEGQAETLITRATAKVVVMITPLSYIGREGQRDEGHYEPRAGK
jgi:hypothetical protein